MMMLARERYKTIRNQQVLGSNPSAGFGLQTFENLKFHYILLRLLTADDPVGSSNCRWSIEAKDQVNNGV